MPSAANPLSQAASGAHEPPGISSLEHRNDNGWALGYEEVRVSDPGENILCFQTRIIFQKFLLGRQSQDEFHRYSHIANYRPALEYIWTGGDAVQ